MTKKKTKKTKKVPIKKAVKKQAVPVRPSPFEIGDRIWTPVTGEQTCPGVIKKKIAPSKSQGGLVWKYHVLNDGMEASDLRCYEESELFPAAIFTLIATDAVRMKRAIFEDKLNAVFEAQAIILAVYRQGQKKPWAYYVIPDESLLFVNKVTKGFWGVDHIVKLQKTLASKVFLRLIPVSSAPQEILTYLGLYVYNRKWVRILAS